MTWGTSCRMANWCRSIHWHDRQWEADTLKDMIDAGFRVASFSGKPKSLEDVFLQITRGRIQ